MEIWVATFTQPDPGAVNCFGLDLAVPFGGYKQSGWGRENGREGVETYTEIKSVMIGL